jgi:hypothetical protein
MESINYNLSEEEFSKGRKILLWIFTSLFFLGGLGVLIAGPVFGLHEIKPSFSIAPFGISLVVGIISSFASIKRKDLFFYIDDDKIEFRYGLFRPKKYSFQWADIKELVMPHKEKKVMLMLKNGSSFVIDLTWLQKKKTHLIRKHIFNTAKYKDMDVRKIMHLSQLKKNK